MKAHITLDMSNPMAVPLLGYLESLPFAKVVKEDLDSQRSTWQQALDEGAVPLRTFTDELNARIERWPDHA